MASDAKNRETFDSTANDAGLWQLRALDLHTAAQVLRDKANDAGRKPDWSRLSLDDPAVQECFKYAGILFQSAMLQGFAVECFLKCFWIAQGNTVAENGEYRISTIQRENHDLPRIAEAVGFAISKEETQALTKLSEFARSFGRYPIAKKWQQQRMVKNDYGIKTGPGWDSDDHAHAETVIARLKSSIDLLRNAPH